LLRVSAVQQASKQSTENGQSFASLVIL
jgi:hypothetical protein